MKNKAHHTHFFRLSLLSILLWGNAAYAETEQSLPEITVKDRRAASGNYKAVAERNVTDMREILADRADINAGGGSLSAQYLSIRAAGQNKIDLVVDNTTSAAEIWYHQGRFQLDPAMIKVVGVDKGAGSASAGIGANNGVVRAQTVDAADLLQDGQNLGARVATTYNSNKGWGGNLSLYGKTDQFDGLLMGSWLNNKDYEAGKGYNSIMIPHISEEGTNTVKNSARKQSNYLLKLGYSFAPNHRVGLSYRDEKHHGIANDRAEMVFDLWRRGPIETRTRTVNLDYKGQDIGFIRDIDANLFHIKAEDERLPWIANDKYYVNQDGSVTMRRGGTKTTGANLNLTSELPHGHLFKYGINVRNEKTHSSDGRSGYVSGESKKEYGLYAEGIWHLDPVTLTTGLRYDHFSLDTLGNNSAAMQKTHSRHISKGVLNPSLGLIWDVTPAFSLNAKWNYASRSPQLASANTLTDSRNSADKARALRFIDPDLKMERSRLAEIGFTWQHEGLSLDGAVFHQETKNFYKVENRVVGNAGKVKTKGYELNAAYRLKGLTARLGMAYADPKADFPLPSSPYDIVPQGRRWVASLSYRFDRPNLELGWRGRFAQSKTFTAGENTIHKQGYGVHDLYANWKPLGNDSLNVNFAVDNVGNKLYYSHSQRSGSVVPPNPGRAYRVGVNYSF